MTGMHIFMTLFLGLFVATSWREMEVAVLNTWRWVIAGGFVPTLLATYGLMEGVSFLHVLSLSYWLLVPGLAMFSNAEELVQDSKNFRKLGVSTVPVMGLYGIGLTGNRAALAASIFLAMLTQTYGIALAARMEG
ncbi:MAG: hypothetical protein ABEJ07_06320 [Candidatus Nanohaloarchaea archaeon]